VRLSEGMARALWELRKQTRAEDDELVFSAERGTRIDHSNLMRRVLKPARDRRRTRPLGRREQGASAETWVGFHTFRHTAATILFRAGWNAIQVQKQLGHSDPGFTQRVYVHLLPEDLPDPSFLDELTAPGVGNERATEATESDRNAAPPKPTNPACGAGFLRRAEPGREGCD
jgi:integrase